jgi:hypothetical protein
MDWEDVLNYHLINQTDELSGFQYYNIFTKCALINMQTAETLTSTKNFITSLEENKNILDLFIKLLSEKKFELNHDKIKISDDYYEVVHFDRDTMDLFLKKHLGGGIISSADSGSFGVLIVGFYDEQLIMKDIDGDFIKQNLEVANRVVDKTRNFILKNKNKIKIVDKFKNKLESDYSPSTSKMTF